MKIVNVDAPFDLIEKVQDLEILPFILDVIKPIEKEYYDHFAFAQMLYSFNGNVSSTISLPTFPIRMFCENVIGYENIVTLIHTIPIYLRGGKPKDEDKKNDNDIIETLGAYYPIAPNNPNIKRDSPYIELFLIPISESSNCKDIHFKWLFTEVLLHELAHAVMDIYNVEGYQKITEQISYCSDFGRWREESMAEAVALSIIKQSGKKRFYNYAKKFVLGNILKEYRLGALLEEVFNHWDFVSIIGGKKNGVDFDLQKEWFTYVKGNPTAEGLIECNNLLTKQYVYKFNNIYYTEEKELVYAIVNSVLTNYETANNRKMDFATFSSIFPYIKTGAEMSYEPSIMVQSDSRFSYKVSLNGVDYSLYDNWDYEALHQFIANSGCKFDEYKNY